MHTKFAKSSRKVRAIVACENFENVREQFVKSSRKVRKKFAAGLLDCRVRAVVVFGSYSHFESLLVLSLPTAFPGEEWSSSYHPAGRKGLSSELLPGFSHLTPAHIRVANALHDLVIMYDHT